ASHQAEAVASCLHRTCRRKTESAYLHTACIEAPAGGHQDAALQESFRLLHARLRMAKGRNPEILSSETHPLLRTCDACGDFYASYQDPDEGPADKMVCSSCKRKVDEDAGIKANLSSSAKARPLGSAGSAASGPRSAAR